MFTLRKPSDKEIYRFIASQRKLVHSYAETGTTNEIAPTGYDLDHHCIKLGSGRETFELAKAAIRGWKMFNFEWIQLCWPDTAIEVGSTVAVIARAMGVWTVNACRIVYVLDEAGAVETFGFAYGTLPNHVECGEERFKVQWNHNDDSVWYDLFAFSRPNHILTRLGYPFVRLIQKRFANDSMNAILSTVRSSR